MKLLAFDVDGTILDTLDSITHHVNETLHENGFYRIDDKEYMRKILGYGSEYLIEKALIFHYNHIYDKNLTKEILEYYSKRYNAEPSYLTKPYQGIPELLKDLKEKGYILVAYSNKPDSVLQQVMADMFEDGLFDHVEGFKDAALAKPNPSVLESILEKFGIAKEEACYIGDSEVDVRTGKNAGLNTIACAWGFRDRDFLEKEEADFLVENVDQLREAIEKLA